MSTGKQQQGCHSRFPSRSANLFGMHGPRVKETAQFVRNLAPENVHKQMEQAKEKVAAIDSVQKFRIDCARGEMGFALNNNKFCPSTV